VHRSTFQRSFAGFVIYPIGQPGSPCELRRLNAGRDGQKLASDAAIAAGAEPGFRAGAAAAERPFCRIAMTSHPGRITDRHYSAAGSDSCPQEESFEAIVIV